MKVREIFISFLILASLLTVQVDAHASPSFQPLPYLPTPRPPRVTPTTTPAATPTPTQEELTRNCISRVIAIEDCVGAPQSPGQTAAQACYACAARFCEGISPDFEGAIEPIEEGSPTCSRKFCFDVALDACGLPPRPPSLPLHPIDVPFTG
jgi:hypothetical protein